MFIGFASDNAAGAHPRIMQAVAEANCGYAKPYGGDDYTLAALKEFERLFGPEAKVCFALCGTGANILGLRSLLRPWQGVICADVAHINTDECGAPEWGTGAKLLPVPSVHGKIFPDDLDRYLPDKYSPHHSTPRVLSITQSTEEGTLYTLEEIKALADKAHANGLYLHMDGSRIANAVAALDVEVCAMTRDAGVDVLSFGGAKNGLLLAEAVVYFQPELAADFQTMRKQSLQLVSKMRFVSVQFTEALKDGLWLQNARHANGMAKYLASRLKEIPNFEVREPEVNAVFVKMPGHVYRALQTEYYFHILNPYSGEARLMCSFATTKDEIDAFIQSAKRLSV